jgi:hypothetical protein
VRDTSAAVRARARAVSVDFMEAMKEGSIRRSVMVGRR